jgi:hypothetical protein
MRERQGKAARAWAERQFARLVVARHVEALVARPPERAPRRD